MMHSNLAVAVPHTPYLDLLNPSQRAAVEAVDGPILVLAGAGTGKTRVLTTRLAHIMALGKARSFNILAVTFTNKAAREMTERVSHLIGPQAEGLWLGTFHSLAAKILRRHADLVGLKQNFTILDADDQLRLLKQVIKDENIAEDNAPAKMLIAIIQRWKDKGLTPDKISNAEAGDLAGGRMAQIYRAYQQRLVALNAADFGDLLLYNLQIFQKHPAVLQQYQNLFRYILVDEYQDTNVAQYLWLRLLAQLHQNICCVGDDDQSIYSWRGAEVGNILKFDKDFADAKIIRLEQNYRSTGNILAAASAVIANNEERHGKTLWTDADAGDLIKVRSCYDGEDEARFVGDEIESGQRAGISLSQMAVLVRAGFQTREFEERLIQLGVPYKVVGGLRFYERAEIRDAIAYLRLIVSPSDDLAFERIVNTPRRGIGEASVQILHQYARAHGISLFESTLRLIETDEIRGAARKGLREFVANIMRWAKDAQAKPHPELAQIVLEESGYTLMLQNDKSIEAPGRLDNLKELINAMAEYENLVGFLEHVSLVMDNNDDNSVEMVSLMTLHGAKGLEFDYVFLPGWEEGIFPSQKSMDEGGAAGLEEERRLAYVGLTRARKKAFISFAHSRRVYNQWQNNMQSRFIGEIPQQHIDFIEGSSRQYGGGFGGYAPRGRAGDYDWDSYRGGRAGMIDVTPRRIESSMQSESGFSVGKRVFHQKFGYGKIVAVDHDKLEIDFEKAGRKKVVESFVTAV
ncbi:MAG: DNA helicase II [Alphaproteobacteria bacterium]|nr:MAG: DNA helicase II [Alphaproteobacteria bacterium]